MNTKNKTVCFVAGRSGGHLVPALTLAHEYKRNDPASSILFFSTNTQLELHIVQESGLVDHYYPLNADSTPTHFYQIPLFLWQMMRAFISTIYLFYKNRPSVVIATGGFIAIPVCFAARVMRIPVELWELNAVPGRAARVLAFCAQKIYICFAECATFFNQKKVQLSAYPIRFLQSGFSKEDACDQLGFDPNKKVLLVLGGSQGSVYLNNLIKQWIEADSIERSRIQIIHQTGSIDTFDWPAFYRSHQIKAFVCAYTDNVELLYRAADMIICRAGAGTLFEIVFFNKRALVIPLEAETTDHQVDNAQAIAKNHPELFCVFRQPAIQQDPEPLYGYIDSLL